MNILAFVLIVAGAVGWTPAPGEGTPEDPTHPRILIERFEKYFEAVSNMETTAQTLKQICDANRVLAGDFLKAGKISPAFHARYAKVLNVLDVMAGPAAEFTAPQKAYLKKEINAFGVIERRLLPRVEEIGIGAIGQAVGFELQDLKKSLPAAEGRKTQGTGSAPPPATPAGPSGTYVSLLSRSKVPAPAFPAAALKAGTRGDVEIHFTTDIFGRPKDVKAVKGDPAFQKEALMALQKFVFEPVIVDGVPTEAPLAVIVRFK